MVNNSTALPPFEGAIFSHPDTGEQFTVTIPFIGVAGLASTPTSDGARLRAASGTLTTREQRVRPQPELLGSRQLLVRRTEDRRQLPQAEHHRSRREHLLDRLRNRKRAGRQLRHVNGVSACRGCCSDRSTGSSDVVGQRAGGGDREHRSACADRWHDPVPDEPLRNGPRLPVRSRAHTGRRVRGPADSIRELRLLRERGRLQRYSDDPRVEQGRGADDLRRRDLQREPAHRTRSPRALRRSRPCRARSASST